MRRSVKNPPYVIKPAGTHPDPVSSHGTLRQAVAQAAHLHWTTKDHHRVHDAAGTVLFSTDGSEQTHFSGMRVDLDREEVHEGPAMLPCKPADRVPDDVVCWERPKPKPGK